ncbi:MAG: ATP-binding protein [Halioglobus sp.]
MKNQSNLIQKKIIASFCLIGAALVLGSYLILKLSIDSVFRSLESEQSAIDLNHVQIAIERQIKGLMTFNTDYASWDDTYEAMADHSLLPSYAKENLSYAQWPDSYLEVDGMLLFDTKGNYVIGTLFDPSSENELSVEAVVLGELATQHRDFTSDIPPQYKTSEMAGFVQTSQGLLLIISGPILNSNYEGTPRGRFLTLHFLNSERLETIGHRAGVRLRLLPLSASEVPQSDSSSEDHYVLKYHSIEDIHGTHLATIEVGTPTTITQVGSTSVRNALLFLSIAIIVAIAMAWQALRHLMVQPLLLLKRHVTDMRETQNLASRYSPRNLDEVGTLAEEINVLAAKLDGSQSRLKIALDDAETSSRVKSEFLATMSHEIRTPLNGVIGMTDLLHRTVLSTEQRNLTETVMSSAQILLSMIDDIFVITQVSSGRKAVSNTQFSLKALLHDVNATTIEAAKLRGIDYRVKLEHSIPDELVADHEALKIVLDKLLDNAVKFTKSGEVVLAVNRRESARVSATNTTMLEFSVRDTGVGIREEDLGNIFDLFSQADSSTTREYGGTGLGLCLSKDLVEMMGGEITVNSKLGEGSQFVITVPATYKASSI